MRNTSKMTTLENKFPLLAVEHGCIISKDADITVAFEVELPELYTVTGAEYTCPARHRDIMRIAYDLEGLHSLVKPGTPHAATIGNFDGVHIGHRQLMRTTREKAAVHGIPSVAITFEPHPLRVLSGVHLPDLLTCLPRKLEILESLGMDMALVLSFTPEMAALTPEDFVRQVMVDALSLKELVIGYDYALGKGRKGNFEALSALGAQHGFTVTQVPAVTVNGQTVSSSRIRESIRAGRVDAIPALLGRLHSVEGTVIHGASRGRNLGFPTANISLGDVLLPPTGVYATWAELVPPLGRGGLAPGVRCMSVTSVGTNPTFGGTQISLESHLFDFSGDLYGSSLRLSFASWLRDEQRFGTVEALKEQIAADARNARDYLTANPYPAP